MLIATLADLHTSFSDALNEDAPPASSDRLYQARTRFFCRGQEDVAKRWFFKPLLKTGTVTLTNGVGDLPTDFEKPNGLWAFQIEDTIYTDPYGEQKNLLRITRNFTTGKYKITLSNDTSFSGTADIEYFATPPLLVNPTDPVLVDPEAVLHFGLKLYFFTNRQWVPMAEARQEYENQVNELMNVLEVPPPGSLLGMKNSSRINRIGTNEKQFYGGNTRRKL